MMIAQSFTRAHNPNIKVISARRLSPRFNISMKFYLTSPYSSTCPPVLDDYKAEKFEVPMMYVMGNNGKAQKVPTISVSSILSQMFRQSLAKRMIDDSHENGINVRLDQMLGLMVGYYSTSKEDKAFSEIYPLNDPEYIKYIESNGKEGKGKVENIRGSNYMDYYIKNLVQQNLPLAMHGVYFPRPHAANFQCAYAPRLIPEQEAYYLNNPVNMPNMSLTRKEITDSGSSFITDEQARIFNAWLKDHEAETSKTKTRDKIAIIKKQKKELPGADSRTPEQEDLYNSLQKRIDEWEKKIDDLKVSEQQCIGTYYIPIGSIFESSFTMVDIPFEAIELVLAGLLEFSNNPVLGGSIRRGFGNMCIKGDIIAEGYYNTDGKPVEYSGSFGIIPSTLPKSRIPEDLKDHPSGFSADGDVLKTAEMVVSTNYTVDRYNWLTMFDEAVYTAAALK